MAERIGNSVIRLVRRPPIPGFGGPGFLTSMRVRKKLMFLHTMFTVALAAILLIALRPAAQHVVTRAELHEARQVFRAMRTQLAGPPIGEEAFDPPRVQVWHGSEETLAIEPATAAAARVRPGEAVDAELGGIGSCVVAFMPGGERGEFVVVQARIPEARDAVWRLYGFAITAVIAVYLLVALALEVLVLPRNVYGPIARLLEADRAVQEGRGDAELIGATNIPADEMGEIMHSRNRAISTLRQKETALEHVLGQLEEAANDLKRKNHLLETARRNLVDADRLASLGMMSAGIAHELNTPLAVLKGLVEKMNGVYAANGAASANGASGAEDEIKTLTPAEAALMLRVVRRLEKLGDGLLDFARARNPTLAPVSMRNVVEEAATLIRLDRDARDMELRNEVPESLVVECDADRMVQVLLNLLRNAGDARVGRGDGTVHVHVRGDSSVREGRDWASIVVEDDGPGIDPAILAHLFEPFASTRLDSRGTGLGLAVSEGIVREHGGMILARNRTDGRTGAVFEVVLPVHAGEKREVNASPGS